MNNTMLKKRLGKLYSKIHACHVCPRMDSQKALRRLDAVDSGMDTFIISQALAETQLRVSGVNFFTVEGRLGNTGRSLERFLNLFGRTVYPPREIPLSSGAIVPRCRDGYIPVYNTELAQCFPGKLANGADRAPTAPEIRNCLRHGFMEEEIRLIKPKILFLMGDKSRKAFHKYVLKTPRKDALGAHIASIVADGAIPVISAVGQKVAVMPIQHASGANRQFSTMLRTTELITLIKRVL